MRFAFQLSHLDIDVEMAAVGLRARALSVAFEAAYRQPLFNAPKLFADHGDRLNAVETLEKGTSWQGPQWCMHAAQPALRTG